MTAVAWAHRVRITPENGAQTVINLNTALAWASGPVETELEYKLDVDTREDVNLSLCDLVRGFRVSVRLTADIGGTLADHQYIAQIVNACARRDHAVELSLDGGTTYRTVLLREYRAPKPLGGKWAAGAKFELLFVCVDLLDEIPWIGGGNW